MPTFMVERYLPGMTTDEVADAVARTDEAVSAMAAAGIELRYVRCTVVPAEESVFCVFEGPSESMVAEVNQRAAFPLDRIVEAVSFR